MWLLVAKIIKIKKKLRWKWRGFGVPCKSVLETTVRAPLPTSWSYCIFIHSGSWWKASASFVNSIRQTERLLLNHYSLQNHISRSFEERRRKFRESKPEGRKKKKAMRRKKTGQGEREHLEGQPHFLFLVDSRLWSLERNSKKKEEGQRRAHGKPKEKKKKDNRNDIYQTM